MSTSVLRLQFFAILFFTIACLSLLGIYHSIATRYGLAQLSLTPLETCQVARIPTKFEIHPEYMNMASEYDYLWEALLPPSGGLVDTGKAEMRVYGLTMFHQLHCLQMIRNAFQDLQPGSIRRQQTYRHHATHQNDEEAHPPERHWTHCLDYLRQVSANPTSTLDSYKASHWLLSCQNILCTADSTVEHAEKNKKGVFIVDGMVVHQCKDPRPLYDEVEGYSWLHVKGRMHAPYTAFLW